MAWTRWIAVAAALILGGWMAFDGTRALIVGDYVTPAQGEYAGRLGPWAGLLQRMGIAPRSTVVKAVFVVFGAAWLVGAAALALGLPAARPMLLGLGILSLWYLPFGTALGIVTIVFVWLSGRS